MPRLCPMNTPSLVFGKDVFSLPPPMVQEMISLVVRREFPIHRVPSLEESRWVECQTMKANAAVGSRFLVHRFYVAGGQSKEGIPRWITHDYVLTRTTPNAFGGWSRQLVAYFITEQTPYYAFNHCIGCTGSEDSASSASSASSSPSASRCSSPSTPSALSPSASPHSILSLLRSPTSLPSSL